MGEPKPGQVGLPGLPGQVGSLTVEASEGRLIAPMGTSTQDQRQGPMLGPGALMRVLMEGQQGPVVPGAQQGQEGRLALKKVGPSMQGPMRAQPKLAHVLSDRTTAKEISPNSVLLPVQKTMGAFATSGAIPPMDCANATDSGASL